MNTALFYILGIGAPVGAIAFALMLVKKIDAADQGSERMKKIAGQIRDGAMAFLKTEYTRLAVFVVAMVIATAKASLVVTFFMHLAWDKKFNLVVFLTSVLFLILFLSMALTDRKEYQHFIDQKTEATQATTAQ